MRDMYTGWTWLMFGAFMLLAAPAGKAARDLPSADAVLRQFIERAEQQRNAQDHVYYLCTKKTVTEEIDSTGRVVSRKVKVGEARAHPTGTNDADKWGSKNGITLNEALLQRFRFTVIGRETVKGRSTVRLNFAPKHPAPPVRQFQDRFLNKAEGTVWIDEHDYELVRASVVLSESVSFGFLGGIDALRFSFERFVGQDGVWMTSWTDTYFKGRKFLKPVQTRKRVDWSGFQRYEEPSIQPAGLAGG
jgi:hypothetical protein